MNLFKNEHLTPLRHTTPHLTYMNLAITPTEKFPCYKIK